MCSPSAPPNPSSAMAGVASSSKPRPVGRVGPRVGDDRGAVHRPEVVLVRLDDGVDGVGGDEAPLDEQRLDRGHPLLDVGERSGWWP